MGEQEREYWIVGGDDLVKVKEFLDEREKAGDAIRGLSKKYGADKILMAHGKIQALMFPDDKKPEGWRLLGTEYIDGKRRPYFFPSRKTTALKAVASELTSVRQKGSRDLTALLAATTVLRGGVTGGMRFLYVGWEYIGDDLLISIPLAEGERASDWKSAGSRRLAMSEYWAMKERATEAADAEP